MIACRIDIDAELAMHLKNRWRYVEQDMRRVLEFPAQRQGAEHNLATYHGHLEMVAATVFPDWNRRNPLDTRRAR